MPTISNAVGIIFLNNTIVEVYENKQSIRCK